MHSDHKFPLVPFLAFFLVIVLAFLLPVLALAQSNQDCLDCHEDDELTKNVGTRVVSLYIDIEKYQKSIHGNEDMSCVDCHQDLDGFEDFPHEDELEPVECEMCHDDVAEIYAGSMHGQAVAAGNDLAPQCWDCHGAHDITPPENPESRVNKFNIPLMCGQCHKEGTVVSDFANVSQDSILAALFPVHPRRGSVQARPDQHRGLQRLSHRPQRAQPQRPGKHHPPGQRGQHVPAMSRLDCEGPREGCPGTSLGV